MGFEVVEAASQTPKPGLAKALRKNPTAAEAVLWEMLRAKRLDGFKFRRQHPMGNYIADFACLSRCLIVEVDGPMHDAQADARRDSWRAGQGYRTIRFQDETVRFDRQGVRQAIREALDLPLIRLPQP